MSQANARWAEWTEERGAPGAATNQAALSLSTGRIAVWLWSATIVVLGLGVLRQIYILAYGTQTAVHTLNLLALDGELTLPAWYSSMLMWTAAGLLALHATVAGNLGRRARWYWWALAVVFVYLSLDETSQLHEYAGNLLPSDFNPGGAFLFRWVIVGGRLVVLVGLAFVPFLLSLPRGIAWRIVVAGTVYVGGAYGMELVGAYIISAQGMETVSYFAAVIAEEGLEMIGLTLFILVLIELLARKARTLIVRLRAEDSAG